MPALPWETTAHKTAAVAFFLDVDLPFERKLSLIQLVLQLVALSGLRPHPAWIRDDDPSLRNHLFERRHSLAFYQHYRKENE